MNKKFDDKIQKSTQKTTKQLSKEYSISSPKSSVPATDTKKAKKKRILEIVAVEPPQEAEENKIETINEAEVEYPEESEVLGDDTVIGHTTWR